MHEYSSYKQTGYKLLYYRDTTFYTQAIDACNSKYFWTIEQNAVKLPSAVK